MLRKNKQIDLLLINSLAPRQRSISDTALENSLATIRTYLETKDFRVEIADYQRIPFIEQGVPHWCLKYLRSLTTLQIKIYNKGIKLIAILIMLLAWPLQKLSLYYKKKIMNQMIENLSSMVKVKQPLFVGIKLWYGDSYKWSLELVSQIRVKYPEAILVAGGPQVNVYQARVLEDDHFDLAIAGPAEEILEELILMRRQTKTKSKFLAKLFSQNNSAFISGKNKSMNQIMGNSRINFITPKYKEDDLADKLFFHTVVDGIGCPWSKCHFCSHPSIYSHYQPRPIEQIIAEFKIMIDCGIKVFRFSSSDTPTYFAGKIAQAILDNNLKIRLSMFARPTKVTPQIYESYCLLIKSGLKAVFMGGETGHDIINDKIMNKGVNKKDIIDSISVIKKASKALGEKCYISLALIYPCPVTNGVSLEDVFNENIDLIKSSNPDSVVVSPPSPFPGTVWYERAVDFGFSFDKDFIKDLMQYEYIHYMPAEFWPKINISLNDQSLTEMLAETGKLRRAINDLGIPTDFSDEYFILAEAMGCKSRKDLMDFKMKSLVDIISGSSSYTSQISERLKKYNSTLK